MVSDNKVAAASYLASLVADQLALAAFTKENKFNSFTATAMNISLTRIIYGLATMERERVRGAFLAEKPSLATKLSTEHLAYSEVRARKHALGHSAIAWGTISVFSFIKARVRNRNGIDNGSGHQAIMVTAGMAALLLSCLCSYRSLSEEEYIVELPHEEKLLLREVGG